MSAAEILFEQRGEAGLVTLNRPQALNALSHDMAMALRPQLAQWAADKAITRVVIQAKGERAFSAGGDIRHLYELSQTGKMDEALAFWKNEYQLNSEIKHYPKPYVALIDGIVMGGGVGISVHGPHRVAGDRYLFAMPEVGIGFFPDVGATFVLPRLPGFFGTFIALTGARLGPADALALGLATHRVPSARFADVVEALAAGGDVGGILAAFSVDPGSSGLAARRPLIDRVFGEPSVEAILAGLDREAAGTGEDVKFAGSQAALIRTKSPTSLKIALQQMRRGAGLSFDQAMRTEFRIVNRLVQNGDFVEGIRAVVIDKDNSPRWNPPALEAVTQADIEKHFAPLPEELPIS